jgi:hypothetical protein
VKELEKQTKKLSRATTLIGLGIDWSGAETNLPVSALLARLVCGCILTRSSEALVVRSLAQHHRKGPIICPHCDTPLLRECMSLRSSFQCTKCYVNPSVVTSKPAMRGHFKTGHETWPGTYFSYEPGAGSRAIRRFCRIVHRQTLDAADGSLPLDLTKRELRLAGQFFSFCG